MSRSLKRFALFVIGFDSLKALLSSISEPKFMLTVTGKVVPVNPAISSVLTMDDLIELKVNQQGRRFKVPRGQQIQFPNDFATHVADEDASRIYLIGICWARAVSVDIPPHGPKTIVQPVNASHPISIADMAKLGVKAGKRFIVPTGTKFRGDAIVVENIQIINTDFKQLERASYTGAIFTVPNLQAFPQGETYSRIWHSVPLETYSRIWYSVPLETYSRIWYSVPFETYSRILFPHHVVNPHVPVPKVVDVSFQKGVNVGGKHLDILIATRPVTVKDLKSLGIGAGQSFWVDSRQVGNIPSDLAANEYEEDSTVYGQSAVYKKFTNKIVRSQSDIEFPKDVAVDAISERDEYKEKAGDDDD